MIPRKKDMTPKTHTHTPTNSTRQKREGERERERVKPDDGSVNLRATEY
jgi:hypothetical protein